MICRISECLDENRVDISSRCVYAVIAPGVAKVAVPGHIITTGYPRHEMEYAMGNVLAEDGVTRFLIQFKESGPLF